LLEGRKGTLSESAATRVAQKAPQPRAVGVCAPADGSVFALNSGGAEVKVCALQHIAAAPL
jgi:hypothetical protein